MKLLRMAVGSLCCMVGLTASSVALGQTAEDGIVEGANAVLRETMLMPNDRIPQKLLRDAVGIAIIPNTLKGGFVVGVRHGRGVVLSKAEDGNWQPPNFVNLTGASVGWQAGVQATDVILVFRTRKGMESLFKNKLTLGVDAAIAAGPAGRQAAAATDLGLKAEILSYSRSRGVFAGVALDGAAMTLDPGATNSYYSAAKASGLTVPASTGRLLAALNEYSNSEVASTASPAAASPAAAPQQASVPTSLSAANAPVPSTDMIRQQMVQANLAMNQVLDDSWKQYLALPREVVTPGQPVTYQMLVDTLARYDRVAADPNFAALAQRPEFAATRRLLKTYADAMTASANVRLTLPQPPGQ